MTVFTTNLQIGKKQDLSDLVKEVNPSDTPFTNSLTQRKVFNSTYNWTDSILPATSTKSDIAEGAALVAGTTDYRTQRTSYTEIFGEAISVSDTTQATDQSGDDPLAVRIADSMKKIARQKEGKYLSAQAGDSTYTARHTDGALSQLVSSAYVDQSSGALTKAMVDDALEAAYGFGQHIDKAYVHHTMKRDLSTLLTFATVTRDVGQERKVTDTVDIYINDFFEINIVPSRFAVSDAILFVDSSMWKEATLIPMNLKNLGTVGLSEERLVNCEQGLMNSNWKGSYGIYNIG